MDEPDIRLEPCPCCNGSAIVVWSSTRGTWYDPPEGIEQPCPECEGDGWVLLEVQPAELEDTLGVLLPEDGKYPNYWPFEPVLPAGGGAGG